MSKLLQDTGRAIGNALAGMGTHTARAAAAANGVSFASQAAQGNFNQQSANIANDLASSRIFDQYAYNSAAAANANAFTQAMWDKSAAWNEKMFNKQMEFNAEQAELNRQFQERMDSTKYQRAITDMKTAGLNPILAVNGGGVSAGGASGNAASVSAPSMGSAQGAMASGGLLNGVSASEGNFSGQMEYMSGILGLISAAIGGFSSAFGSLGSLGDLGSGLGAALAEAITKTYGNDKDYTTSSDLGKQAADKLKEWQKEWIPYGEDYKKSKQEYFMNKYGINQHAGSGHSR